jgi:hypothetical protein
MVFLMSIAAHGTSQLMESSVVRRVVGYGSVAIFFASLMSCGQYSRQSARVPSEYAARGELPTTDASAATTTARLNARLVNFQQAEAAPRRIIYEAEISLVVKDVSAVEAQVSALLKQFNGYVAESTVDRTQGEQLSGRWRVRIPVEHYDTFLDSVSKLGVPENRHQTAQDVTEEFVDLEAQISNKKKLEERIVKLVEDTAGEIEEVIEVERELGRVRGEIEQMEGRLRYLANRTALTTVTIIAREVQDYVPPEAPTFVNRIRQAWVDSLEALRVFGEQLVVAIVYASPWIVVLGAVVVPTLWYLGKRNAAARNRPGTSPPQG